MSESEVEQHCPIASFGQGVEHDVRRLDIAMHDPALVDVVKRGADLLDRSDALSQRGRVAAGTPVRQGLALDDLHLDVVRSADHPGGVHREHIGMVQAGHELVFLLEERAHLRTSLSERRQDLEADLVASQRARPVAVRHRATPQHPGDLVRAVLAANPDVNLVFEHRTGRGCW